MLIKEINKNFLLPIEFDSHKKEIFENLYEDLELLKQTNSKESAYQKVFQAKSPAGKELMEKWCKYYTTNKQFLKDSQKLYKNFHTKKLNYQPSIIQDCWDKWHSIKTMENFIEKFQYLEWEKLEFLNKSEMFLAVLTFYQSVSPILSLLAPVILLLIPFLILKVLKRPITLSEYIRVMGTTSIFNDVLWNVCLPNLSKCHVMLSFLYEYKTNQSNFSIIQKLFRIYQKTNEYVFKFY